MKSKLYESNDFIEDEDEFDEDEYELDEDELDGGNDYGIEESDSKLTMVDKVISGINDEAYRCHEQYRAKYLEVDEGEGGVINIYWGTQDDSYDEDMWNIIETLKQEIYDKYDVDVSIHFIFFLRDTCGWLWETTNIFNLSNLDSIKTCNIIVVDKDLLMNYIEENTDRIDLESLEYDISDILDEASDSPVSEFVDDFDNFRIIYEDELKNSNYNYFDESLYRNAYDEIEEIYNNCELQDEVYVGDEYLEDAINEIRPILRRIYDEYYKTEEEKKDFVFNLCADEGETNFGYFECKKFINNDRTTFSLFVKVMRMFDLDPYNTEKMLNYSFDYMSEYDMNWMYGDQDNQIDIIGLFRGLLHAAAVEEFEDEFER